MTTTLEPVGYCPYCSSLPSTYVYHTGKCPKVKLIEYYPNGTVKRIEFIEKGVSWSRVLLNEKATVE